MRGCSPVICRPPMAANSQLGSFHAAMQLLLLIVVLGLAKCGRMPHILGTSVTARPNSIILHPHTYQVRKLSGTAYVPVPPDTTPSSQPQPPGGHQAATNDKPPITFPQLPSLTTTSTAAASVPPTYPPPVPHPGSPAVRPPIPSPQPLKPWVPRLPPSAPPTPPSYQPSYPPTYPSAPHQPHAPAYPPTYPPPVFGSSLPAPPPLAPPDAPQPPKQTTVSYQVAVASVAMSVAFVLDPTSAGSIDPEFQGLSIQYESARRSLNTSVYRTLLQNLVTLGGRPVIRIMAPPSYPVPLDTWQALGSLTGDLGLRVMPCADLKKQSPAKAAALMQNALNVLGLSRIYTIELANEPDRYSNYDSGRYDYNYVTNGQYDNDLFRYQNAVDPLVWAAAASSSNYSGAAGSTTRIYSSAACNQVRCMDESQLNDHIDRHAGSLRYLTAHWYPTSTGTHGLSWQWLFKPMAVTTAVSGIWAEVGRRRNVPFRVAEANSVSGGGMAGVSDTLAAALWVLDYSFELAVAGAVGVNWHSTGCNPYSPIYDLYSACGGVRANAPYMGMLAFLMAVGGRARVWQGPSYDQAVGSRLKVWLIQPQVSTELLSDSGLSQGSSPCLNVVVINKNSELEGLLNIDLPADQTRPAMQVVRLEGDAPDATINRIRLGGQTPGADGRLQPPTQTYALLTGTQGGSSGSQVPRGFIRFTVEVPPASAALLLCSPAAGS